MVVESVILSRGRMNIETSSIEPQTMHEITEYVNESFNAMLFKNSSLDLLRYELNLYEFEFILFGGWVRDRILEYFSKKRIKSKDIDLVCHGTPMLIDFFHKKNFKFTENSFGGFGLELDSQHVDIWELEKTYLIQKYNLDRDYISLLKTTDYTMNAIAFQPGTINSKSILYDYGCISSVLNKEIEFLANEVAFPNIQAARAVIFSAKMDFKLSETVRLFIREVCSNENRYKLVRKGIIEYCPKKYEKKAINILLNVINNVQVSW